MEAENIWNIFISHSLPDYQKQSGCVVLFPSLDKEDWKILLSSHRAGSPSSHLSPHQKGKIDPRGVAVSFLSDEWGRQTPLGDFFISSAEDRWGFRTA